MHTSPIRATRRAYVRPSPSSFPMLPSFFWFSIVPLSERPLLGLCRPRSPIPSPRKPAPHLCARSSDCDSSRPTPAGRSPADDSSRHNVMTRVVSCVHPSLLRVFHGSLAATAPASESWLAPSAAPSLAYGCREPRHFFSQLRAVYIDLRSLRIPRLSRPVRRASRIATSESPSTEPLLRLSLRSTVCCLLYQSSHPRLPSSIQFLRLLHRSYSKESLQCDQCTPTLQLPLPFPTQVLKNAAHTRTLHTASIDLVPIRASSK